MKIIIEDREIDELRKPIRLNEHIPDLVWKKICHDINLAASKSSTFSLKSRSSRIAKSLPNLNMMFFKGKPVLQMHDMKKVSVHTEYIDKSLEIPAEPTFVPSSQLIGAASLSTNANERYDKPNAVVTGPLSSPTAVRQEDLPSPVPLPKPASSPLSAAALPSPSAAPTASTPKDTQAAVPLLAPAPLSAVPIPIQPSSATQSPPQSPQSPQSLTGFAGVGSGQETGGGSTAAGTLQAYHCKNALDPLESVRDSCAWVVEHSLQVKIQNEAIDAFVKEVKASEKAASLLEGVTWDSAQCHYHLDAAYCGPLTVQYILVMDALNFCFWGNEAFEYDVLAGSLKKVLIADSHAFDAKRLEIVTEDTVLSWFPGNNKIPMVQERVNRLREVGQVLLAEFGGLAYNLVLAADKSAVSLVKLMLMYFPGFRDTVVYKGSLVHFYKRAQIFTGDVWAAYGRPKDPNHPFFFSDIHKLTMFADYRVPQILRSRGILEYSTELSAAVDALQEVPFGSAEETEIRAATVVAVERLQEKLQLEGINLLVLEVDWLLWQWGEKDRFNMAPHHRTLTIYY